MAATYVPRQHVVAYDAAAWARSADPFWPAVPLDARFAAKVAVALFGATSAWDTLACFACLTHSSAPLTACVQVLFCCDAAGAAAVLAQDEAGCQPWLLLALHSNVCVLPGAPEPDWSLVHTADNKRHLVRLDAATGVPAAVYSVHTGRRKPADFVLLPSNYRVIATGHQVF